MKKTELKNYKIQPKHLSKTPIFTPLRRKHLPKPFNQIGGARITSSGMIDVSDEFTVLFVCRDGEALTDTAFYGYLMCKLSNGNLYPITEYHWHPSHKGQHIKTPCGTELNYTNRMLPRAPELSCAIGINRQPDPRDEKDRIILIEHFCKITGISITSSNDDKTHELWAHH